MRNLLFFLTILIAVSLIGCGGSGAKLSTVKVTGIVTLDGAPVADASLIFVPKTQGQGHSASGRTDADGRYQLTTPDGKAGAGTTPGEYRVAITKTELDSDAPPSDRGAPVRNLIPTRYAQASSSGLTATVKEEKVNEINFELTSN